MYKIEQHLCLQLRWKVAAAPTHSLLAYVFTHLLAMPAEEGKVTTSPPCSADTVAGAALGGGGD